MPDLALGRLRVEHGSNTGFSTRVRDNFKNEGVSAVSLNKPSYLAGAVAAYSRQPVREPTPPEPQPIVGSGMDAGPPPPPADFRALSARLGRDPLRIQGPGGNTSFKFDDAMWIKASGTELADAKERDVFVAVSVSRARAEIDEDSELDGTCRAAMLDPASTVRPSIETTFHALMPWRVVSHTHSVSTLAHVVSRQGTQEALRKLEGLDAVAVPYRKPGLPLTRAIRDAMVPEAAVFLLRNHGLVVCGNDVESVDHLMEEVERRLALNPWGDTGEGEAFAVPAGWRAVPEFAALARARVPFATAGTLYPDHAVFLGPGVGIAPDRIAPEQLCAIVPGIGAMLRDGATATQHKMLRCLYDVIVRVPLDWGVDPIGEDAEAELMNWDAETYRQKLAGTA